MLWLWLYWPVIDYLGFIFSKDDFRTNQLLLIGVAILVVIRLRQRRLSLPRQARPVLAGGPLMVMLGGSILYLLTERFLDINILSALLFGIASYGLLGLWLTPRHWWAGIPVALLFIGTLPFNAHLQTFIGYPMRIMTATIIRDGLTIFGITSVGVDTILVFENGISHIDLPCSGVKSLWAGILFLLAVTWIDRRPLNGYWFIVAVILASLLFVTNLFRVTILVLVGQVAGWSLVAEMMHVPLGVLGFGLTCGVGLLMLKQMPLKESSPSATHTPWPLNWSMVHRPPWLAVSLLSTVLLMGLLYTPRPLTGLGQAAPQWQFPAEFVTEPLPLKPDELAWLTRDGADSASRLRFSWQGISGSMIIITSHTWRGHHRPERCFEVYGLTLNDSRPHLVRPDFPIRYVVLGDEAQQADLSASYWFQSEQQTTDDYATRIWADVSQPDKWVLVSILFEGMYEPQTEELESLYLMLHTVVEQHL